MEREALAAKGLVGGPRNAAGLAVRRLGQRLQEVPREVGASTIVNAKGRPRAALLVAAAESAAYGTHCCSTRVTLPFLMLM